MGNSLGSGNTTVATSNKDPWSPTSTPLQNVVTQAGSLYNAGGPQVYTGPQVAGFTDPTNQGFQLAQQGAGVLQQGAADNTPLSTYRTLLNDQMQSATGDPMQNPYMQDVINRQASAMTDQLNRQFAGSGQLGSYANARSITDNTGAFLNSSYANMYQQGVANKQQAVQNAQQLAAAIPGTYSTQAGMLGQAAQGLGQIGAQQQQQNQTQINAGIDLYNKQQMQPYNSLQMYENSLLPISYGGGSSNQVTGNQTSPVQLALGAATGGLGLLSGLGFL
jgi:hypothetical protein